MAIRVICKNCGSKIDAKDELLGQTKHCPKCKLPILIAPNLEDQNTSVNSETDLASTTVAQPLTPRPSPIVNQQNENHIVYDNMEHLPTHDPPTKLLPHCRYFIFAHDRMLAAWEIGKGWQYNTVNGFVSAKINQDMLPTSGTFKFIEMIIVQHETSKQLSGIRTFSLGGRWAIPAIGREPEEILTKIDGKAIMSKQQRLQLLTFIRKHYMADFLHNAKEVYDYLACDFTSESDVFVS